MRNDNKRYLSLLQFAESHLWYEVLGQSSQARTKVVHWTPLPILRNSLRRIEKDAINIPKARHSTWREPTASDSNINNGFTTTGEPNLLISQAFHTLLAEARLWRRASLQQNNQHAKRFEP